MWSAIACIELLMCASHLESLMTVYAFKRLSHNASFVFYEPIYEKMCLENISKVHVLIYHT